jgi:uncharacterized membrane protein HdeD (DUF308 family)
MVATATAQSPAMRWWFPLVLGVLAILVGFSFLAEPAVTSVGFVFGLSLYWIATGIFDLVQLLWDRTEWGWRLAGGVLGIFVGGWILSGMLGRDHPLGTAFAVGTAFTWILGFLGLIYGVLGIVRAFRGGGWVPGVLGALGLLFGFVVLVDPLSAALALPFSLGLLLIAGGIATIIAAIRMR